MASSKNVWLVTGASSGLGLGMALAALRAGHKVVAGARNPEKAAKTYPELESLGGRWVQLDVTSPKTQQIVEQVVKDEGGIDVVVNNAGYALAGPLEDFALGKPLPSTPDFCSCPRKLICLTQKLTLFACAAKRRSNGS